MSQLERDRIKVLERLKMREISQKEAADSMCLSTRQIRRLQRLYAEEGDRGVCSKKRGKPSNHRIEAGLKDEINKQINKKYREFGPKLAYEKLTEIDKYKVSLSVVRSIMIENQIWHPKRAKKPIIHPIRERRARLGELIQFDGSIHDWFVGRAPKCVLLVFIDDATSKLMLLKFVAAENLLEYFLAWQEYMERYGRPEAVYCDRHSALRNRKPELLKEKGMTQMQRAMKSLNIELVHAHSPQAKGRVERANRTLQDRLIKEMSLAGISSMESANNFLEGFMTDYNKRFEKEPKSQVNAHRTIDERTNLREIFSWHEERVVTKNHMIQYDTKHYVINAEDKMSRELMNAKITVIEDIEGRIKLVYKGKELKYRIYEEMPYAESGHELKLRESAAEHWIKREKNKPRGNPNWCNNFNVIRRAV